MAHTTALHVAKKSTPTPGPGTNGVHKTDRAGAAAIEIQSARTCTTVGLPLIDRRANKTCTQFAAIRERPQKARRHRQKSTSTVLRGTTRHSLELRTCKTVKVLRANYTRESQRVGHRRMPTRHMPLHSQANAASTTEQYDIR